MESNFREDVMNDLKWERSNIEQQIEMLQPLRKTLHQSSGMKIINKGSYFLFEFICWILALGTIIWNVFLYKMAPFYSLSNMIFSVKENNSMNNDEISLVEWSIRGLLLIITILLIILAKQIAKLRKKLDVSNVAAKTIIDLQKQLELRIQKIDELENKYAYLLQDGINIELNEFTNPLPPPPDGDTYL